MATPETIPLNTEITENEWDEIQMAAAETFVASSDGLEGLSLDLSHAGPPPAWWVKRVRRWDAQELRELRIDTRWRLKRTTQDIITIGNNLRRARELVARLKPGTWGAWSTHATGLSRQHIWRFMRVAEQQERCNNLLRPDSLFSQFVKKPAKDEPDDDVELRAPLYAREQIVASAFAYYRRRYPDSYPYRNLPVHVSMQKINQLRRITDDETLRSSGMTVGESVADTYHPHRMHAKAQGMRSPFETFSHDAYLKAALRKELELGGFIGAEGFSMLALSQGTQACANFRPGFAMSLYRRYCQPGCVVLDTSTGYGGRLVGFIASGLAGQYIGIDPSTKTHEGNTRLARELGFSDHVELICTPAEDVDPRPYAGLCDFAFTSPPYYAKERYSDEETQSWVRYGSPETWREGFLVPMLDLTYQTLKPGAFAVLNVAPVKVGNRRHQVDQWVQEEAQAVGFVWDHTEEYRLPRSPGSTDATGQQRVEPVLVFQKPERDDLA